MRASHSIGAGSDDTLFAWLIAHQDLALLVGTFGGMLLLMVAEQVWPRRPWVELHYPRWIGNWLLARFNFFALLFLMFALSTTPSQL